MPNHITNRLTGLASVLSMLIDEQDENGKVGKCVNFNKIIPCPPEIVLDDTPTNIKGRAELTLGLLDFNEQFDRSDLNSITRSLHLSNAIRDLKEGPHPKDYSDEHFELFVRYMRAYRKHGMMDWHDWNCANWGTKWRAYSFEFVSENEIKFDTAWNAPHPVIEKLAALNPAATFRHEWASEDTGSNVGVRDYANGAFIERLLKGTNEGYELAFALGAGDAENYELVGGSYQYKDEE
jgi:hypothetical protein